jgi:hypothetical protein
MSKPKKFTPSNEIQARRIIGLGLSRTVGKSRADEIMHLAEGARTTPIREPFPSSAAMSGGSWFLCLSVQGSERHNRKLTGWSAVCANFDAGRMPGMMVQSFATPDAGFTAVKPATRKDSASAKTVRAAALDKPGKPANQISRKLT